MIFPTHPGKKLCTAILEHSPITRTGLEEQLIAQALRRDNDCISGHHRGAQSRGYHAQVAGMCSRRIGEHARSDAKRAKTVQDRSLEPIGAGHFRINVNRV